MVEFWCKGILKRSCNILREIRKYFLVFENLSGPCQEFQDCERYVVFQISQFTKKNQKATKSKFVSTYL